MPLHCFQALSAIGNIVLGLKAGQEKLGACTVVPKAGAAPVPALQVCVFICVCICVCVCVCARVSVGVHVRVYMLLLVS